MSYPSHAPNGINPSSRFSTLKVFKLRSGSGSGSSDSVPPPPPPKDSVYASSPNPSLNPPPSAFYNKSLFSRSAASLSPSLSPESNSGPATPLTPYSITGVGSGAALEFGKGPASGRGSVNGRGATASPVPSASGASLRSVSGGASSGGGGEHLASPSVDGSTDSGGCYPNPNPNANLGMYSMGGTDSSPYSMGQASTNGTIKPKKSIFKFSSLGKRNKSRRDLSDGSGVSGSVSRSASINECENGATQQEGDQGITSPWNFQHHIHVDEAYIGLPPSWSNALSDAGFNDEEIAAIQARRRAAAPNSKLSNPHTTYSTERPASPLPATSTPPTPSTSSSATLLSPVPRSTSLAKGPGQGGLRINPPSMYSVTSSVGGGALSTAGTSPAPSPRAPSFSMKSFVSGIKNSLTNDSASGSGGERASVAGEESEQYIFVEGDGPDEGADQGMGDETLIEPYPFDSASVSTHQSHTTRAQYASGQGQPQTPRTQVHPQIQVQRTQSDSAPIPFPTSTTTPSRMPSPLVHSASLPIPTPLRGYSYSNPSASPSPSHSLASANANANRRPGAATVPPRTPPRRIYHVVNASSDSYDGQNYFEPPPAYASPKRNDWTPRKEKEGLHKHGGIGTPLSPNRLVPPTPGDTLGESSGVSSRDDREEGPSIDFDSTHIPETADDVLDISSANSSFYTDNLAHEEPVEMDPAQRSRLLSPTPPLVIDKRLTKLATMPPRISFHQEGSLEDWSESLFSAIGGKAGKRTSIMIGSKGGNAAGVKAERRTTLRPMSPVLTASGSASAAASSSRSLTAPAPLLPDVSLGANISLGAHMRESVVTLDEEDEQEEEFQAEDEEDLQDTPEEGTEEEAEKADEKPAEGEQEGIEEIDDLPFAPSPPILPDVSLGSNVSSLGKDLGGPIPPTSSTSSEPSGRASVDSLPPPPPPKPKPSLSLAPPQINTIPGISVKSPISPLFAAKPHPLPIPIPLAQIRTQLRPAPQKSLHPPPSSSPPAFKQTQPQLALQPQSLSQPLPRPQPQPQVSLPITFSQTSSQRTSSQSLCTTESRPASSQTLLPVRSSPGDRDSGMSTMTVTPATITTAKTEVVRRAVASVVDSDVVSLASRRESMASTAETETQQVEYEDEDLGAGVILTPGRRETPDDSLVSESSSASLLRGSSRSPTWPSPPPAPVELDTDTTPRPPRFRTTSLGRVSQIQAMGGVIGSPHSSHFSYRSSDTHRSSETVFSSTSEGVLSTTTPKRLSGVPQSPQSPSAPKTKGSIASEARMMVSRMDTFGGPEVEDWDDMRAALSESPTPISPSTSTFAHPLLTSLQPYITPLDPTSCFTDLVEIAEGESGSVFAARVSPSSADSLSHAQRQEGAERPIPAGTSHLAIKRIPLPPPLSASSLAEDSPLSSKLSSLLHELALLKDLNHEHLLLLDAVYVGPSTDDDDGAGCASALDTSLWIRMELMERSLADVIGLVGDGLALQERMVARFANDVLHGLEYLQKQYIAHRDVRSDNLLLNASGVVKLADFSNAVRVTRNTPTATGAVGVIYWQAPEMRAGPYNALKVDLWSLGATVWELAETVPPFSMPASPSTQTTFSIQSARQVGPQWPPLSHPEHYSRGFHEFLRLCGREAAGRPGPGELLNTPFIRNACGRAVILQLLSQCRSIEEVMVAREAAGDGLS